MSKEKTESITRLLLNSLVYCYERDYTTTGHHATVASHQLRDFWMGEMRRKISDFFEIYISIIKYDYNHAAKRDTNHKEKLTDLKDQLLAHKDAFAMVKECVDGHFSNAEAALSELYDDYVMNKKEERA